MLAINATFIGQFIVLLVLLWFIYKVVVPMLAGPIEERQRKIALGRAAAGEREQELVREDDRGASARSPAEGPRPRRASRSWCTGTTVPRPPSAKRPSARAW